MTEKKRQVGRQRKNTVEEISEALQKTKGNVSATARRLGCSRVTITKRINESPKLRQVMEDEREGLIDLAESALLRAVHNGEPWAVSMTLKTIGKYRGYVERSETNISGTVGVTIIDDIGTDDDHGS